MTEQQYSRIDDTQDSSELNAERWRNEIQARVARYKHRRGRRVEGAFSMRFPFPPEEVPVPALDPAESEEESTLAAENPPNVALSAIEEEVSSGPIAELPPTFSTELGKDPAQPAIVVEPLAEIPGPFAVAADRENEPAPARVPSAPRPRARRKVIAFPRQASVAEENPYLLADPVLAEQPRILDVPEELEATPATPFLDGLQLEPLRNGQQVADTRQEQDELPHPAASLARRIQAALIDFAVVGAGCAIFGGVAYRMLLGVLVIGKPLVAGAVLIPVIFWSLYQYLFLVHNAGTVGMRVAHIRLSTFKGSPVRRAQRRLRVFGLYLSAMSLAMGLLWAFVDVDALCWHDRISRTYPVVRQ